MKIMKILNKSSQYVHQTEENIDENSILRQKSHEKRHKRGRNLKKKAGKGQPKSFVSSKETVMIKTVPLFFYSSKEEKEDEINLGESVYTQISKKLLFNN